MTLLEIEHLRVSFRQSGKEIKAVRDVSFKVKSKEILGIVGESGSGKSVTAKSILGLMDKKAVKKEGKISFNGKEILQMNDKELRALRGNDMAMIFQDPMTSLNPVFTIGTQLCDVIRKNRKVNKKESRLIARQILERVGIPSPEKRMTSYPHEFSGGMLQRVMIAMALSCRPSLLIADEPTTALDVTIQAQILKLMKGLKEDQDTAIMLITHDLGVVADVCDRVIVMYGGHILEEGTVDDIFNNPSHPYTQGLLASIPKLNSMDRLVPIEGMPPNPLKDFRLCPFYERCMSKVDKCEQKKPPYVNIADDHFSMCWLNTLKGDSND